MLYTVKFRVPPLSVTDVTLAIGFEYENRDRRTPIHRIGEWAARFGVLKTLTLESGRDKAHGLLAFANSIDALRIIDDDKNPTPLSHDELAAIPAMWNIPSRWIYPRRRRVAVLNLTDVGLNNRPNAIKIFDEM